MDRKMRARRERFESIMSRVDGAERRALADLRNLDYGFKSLHEARMYRARLRALPAATDAQIASQR
jgi:hypothetical protein